MARAVLRPRLRLRGHAALARAARRPDLGGAAAHGVPAAGGVVGVDLHHLDGELVRPGRRAGAPGADRRDAREPADGGRGAARVHERRDAVRRRLRGAPGRAQPRQRAAPRSATRRARPVFAAHLAWSVASAPLWIAGALLDGDARVVVWIAGAGDGLRRAARSATGRPGSGSQRLEEWTIEGATSPSASSCSSSSRWASRSSSPAPPRPTPALDRRRWSSRSPSRSSARPRCGGCTSARSRARAGGCHRRRRGPGPPGRDAYTYLHVPIVAGIVLARRRRRAGDRPSRAPRGAVRRRSRSSAARPSTSSGTCCSGSGWPSARASRGSSRS